MTTMVVNRQRLLRWSMLPGAGWGRAQKGKLYCYSGRAETREKKRDIVLVQNDVEVAAPNSSYSRNSHSV